MICSVSGKQSLSRSDAQHMMRRLQQDRWSIAPGDLNIYRCQGCARWHVGHRSSPIKRRPQRPAMKRCSKCGILLPFENFGTRFKGRLWRSECLSCEGKRRMQYHYEDKARAARAFRRWRVKATYGLSLEELENLHKQSRGLCAICRGRHRTRPRLDVDHNHQTKTFRGLLCGDCNSGIGYFREDISRLRAAIRYLQRHVGHKHSPTPRNPNMAPR